jgi:hypothetical protein
MGNVGGFALAVIGLAIVVAALGLWFRLLHRVALAGRRTPLFVAIGVGVALAFAAALQQPGWIGGALAALAIALGLVWIALGLVAPQSRQRPAIAVGAPILDFEALDHAGRRFRLSSLGAQPVLLKFFRGHW